MSDPGQLEEVKHRWEQARHSDRAAVDIGLSTLRSAILVNAGSLVALLALSGQVWKESHDAAVKLLSSSRIFVWGLLLAVCGSVVAYFYQSLVTRLEYKRLDQTRGIGNGPSRKLRWTVVLSAVLMVMLVLASYVVFAWGASNITSALQSGP
jgi:hypothetical protein